MNDNLSHTARNLMDTFAKFNRLNWKRGLVEGLKPSEMVILFCLNHQAAPDSIGIKVSEISSSLGVTSPSVTPLIKGLESAGLVERNIDPYDRRAVRVKITDKGKNIIKKAMDELYISFEGLVEYLGEEKSNELVELLKKVNIYFHEIKG